MALDQTAAQFDVIYHAENDSVEIVNGNRYTLIGSEVQAAGPDTIIATLNTKDFYIDGQSVLLTAYYLEGYTYFRLRDIGQALDFDVRWDAETNSIHINSEKTYHG